MVQILRQPSFGQLAGEALGTGLGQGLGALANFKLQEIQQRYQQAALAPGLRALGQHIGMPGIEQLSGVNPQILGVLIKNKLAAPQEQSYAQALTQLLGGGEQQQQVPSMATAEAQPLSIEQMLQPQVQQQLQPSATAQPSIASTGLKLPTGARLTAQQASQLAKLAQSERKQKFLEQKEMAKAAREETRESRVAQEAINKETKAYYDKTLEEDKVAKEADITLKKMINLIDKGKLPPAGFYNFFNKLEEVPSTGGALVGGGIGQVAFGPPGALVGGAIGSLIGPIATLIKTGINYKYPDAEEFTKLSNSFIRGAKAVFGARITDSDLKAWLATIPTLSQTDAGKKAIINNMELFNDATHARTEALKKILKANKGKRPENLPILVEDVAAPELDKIAKKFVIV